MTPLRIKMILSTTQLFLGAKTTAETTVPGT